MRKEKQNIIKMKGNAIYVDSVIPESNNVLKWKFNRDKNSLCTRPKCYLGNLTLST